MPETADLEQCAQAIMEVVPLAMHFIRTQMRRHVSPALSVPQFRTLTYLNRHAGASLSEVADHLGVTPATASTMVDRLVQNGLVDRVAAPDERRRSVLTLTEAGAGLLKSAREATRRRMVQALSQLSPREVAAVADAMSLLHSAFREAAARESDDK